MRVVRINRNYLQYTEKATEYPVHVGRARGPTALAEPPPFLLLGSGSTFFFFPTLQQRSGRSAECPVVEYDTL